MSAQHLKAALKDQTSEIEYQMIEINQKLAQLRMETEIQLREKIELEMRLRKIEEELNLFTPSGKSIAFAPSSQISCQSMSRCTMCRHAAFGTETPNISSLTTCASLEYCNDCQQHFNQDNQSTKISSPMSAIVNRSLHTQNSFNQQSCQSIANCSLCRKIFIKPGTSCTSSNCELCNNSISSMIVEPSSSCKSLNKCSLCMRTYLVPTVQTSENLISQHSCKSIGECSFCRNAFAHPSVKASECPKAPSELSKAQAEYSKAPSNYSIVSSVLSEAKTENIKASEHSTIPIEISKAMQELSKAPSVDFEVRSSSIKFDPSCKSLASCSACQRAHNVGISQAPSVPLELSKAPSELSKVQSNDLVKKSTTIRFHPSCKSLASCSDCQRNYSDEKNDPELSKASSEIVTDNIESSKISEGQIHVYPSCKSLASCSACQKAHADGKNNPELSKAPSEQDNVIPIHSDPSCKSLASCSACQRARAKIIKSQESSRSLNPSESEIQEASSEKIIDNLKLSEVKSQIKADSSCKSLDQCSVCQKTYFGNKPSETSKGQSELLICDECEVSQKQSQFQAFQSCMSLAQCSVCQKAFQQKTSEISKDKSGISICDECDKSTMTDESKIMKSSEDIKTLGTCKSLAECSVCQKAFAELSNNKSSPICDECIESKISIAEEKSKKISLETVQAAPSCKSIAECSLCKKAFAESETQTLGENKPVICDDCRESIESLVDEQLNKAQEMEAEIKEDSIGTMKVDPSCKSLGQCSVCRRAYTGPKGPAALANMSDVECLSADVCDLCSKIPGKSLEDLMKDKPAGINSVADIVYSVYYSTTRVPCSESKEGKKKKDKSGKSTPNQEPTISMKDVNPTKAQNEEGAEGTSELKPAKLQKSRKQNFVEDFCPSQVVDDDETETASEIFEKNRQKRAAEEEKKRKNQKKKDQEAYKEFLNAQKAEEKLVSEPKIPSESCRCPNDDGIQNCFYDNECAKFPSEPDLGAPKKHIKVEYSKTYLKMKYAIEMQNYKISKLCQELKVMKQRGLHNQMARLKEQLSKEIEKLKQMIEHAMKVQKDDSEGAWGSIPLSTFSMSQLENNFYDFERVEMPKKPSEVTLNQNLFDEIEEKLIQEEKLKLIKNEELRSEQERLMCLQEKTKDLENELYVLKFKNEKLKMAEKYFDSVLDDFNPDEKFKEVQDMHRELMDQIKKMKEEFDEIHAKIHEPSVKTI